MTTAIIWVASFLLAVVIIASETARRPSLWAVDAMRCLSAIYLVCFALIPPYMELTDLRSFPDRSWGWIANISLEAESYAIASALSLAAYPIIRWAHDATATRLAARAASIRPRLDDDYVARVGLWALVVGGLALALYVVDIGGVTNFMAYGVLTRAGVPMNESRFAFLKNVMMLVVGASFCFFAVRNATSGRVTTIARRLFLPTFLLSLAVLFHQGGRVTMITYLATFVIAPMMMRGRVRPAVVGMLSAGFVAIVLLGNQLFAFVLDPSRIGDRLGSIRDNAGLAVSSVMIEFTFPYATFGNAIRSVPSASPFRWFLDLPLGILYLIPQRLFGVQHPASVSAVNTALLRPMAGTIPVDLLSLGYFSAGIVGVALIAAGFGYLAARIDRWFPPAADPVVATFRTVWMFIIAYRVMYADPVIIILDFHVFVITTALFAPALWRRLRGALGQVPRPLAGTGA